MLTTFVAVLIAVVPGMVLSCVLPPGRDRWIALAASPILTLGLVTVSMGWLGLLGLPDGALAVFVTEIILAFGSVGVAWLVRRRRCDGDDRPEIWRLRAMFEDAPRLDVAALGSAWVLISTVGWVVLGWFPAPPGWDAMNHAFLTRRIIEAGTTAVTSVCVSGSTDVVASCNFYPLAANVQWAQAALISGGRISDAMGAWVILVAPIALATAIYACVRLLGGHPVVAACAAAAPAVVGPLWWAMRTGRITEEAGSGLAVGTALLVAVALTGKRPVRMGLLAGVSAGGVVMTHTYDVLFVFVFGLAVISLLLRRGAWVSLGRGALAIVGAGLFSVLPFLGSLLGADAQRLSSPPRYVGHLGEAVRFWVFAPSRYVLFGYPEPGVKHAPWGVATQIALVLTVVVLLASVGGLFLRRLGWARPWLLTWFAITAVGIWTSYSDSAAAQGLAGLWYGVPERLRTMIAPVYGVLAVAGACVIALAIQALVQRTRPTANAVTAGPSLRWAGHGATVVGSVVLLGALGALAAVPSSWHPIRTDLARRAPHGPSYERVDQWLASHTAKGKVVAYDRNLQFMTWSYADYGVAPLFGIPPLIKENKGNYTERYRAFMWLADSKGAKPAGCAVERFGVQYVAVGGPHVPGRSARYSNQRIAKSPNVSLVHEDGKLRIYQVTDAGRACPR